MSDLTQKKSIGKIPIRSNISGDTLIVYNPNSAEGQRVRRIDATLLINQDGLGTAAYADLGGGATEVPVNGDLGSAAYVDTGTDPENVPLNSDLGSAAYVDTGGGASDVPLNSDLGTFAYEDFDAGPWGSNDYVTLPGGLVFMWASASGSVGNSVGDELTVVVNYPTTLNTVYKVYVSQSGDTAESAEMTYSGHTITTSSVSVRFRRNSGGNAGGEVVTADVFIIGD